MFDDFKGGQAVVTGGASGLGEATAYQLAAMGMKVFILDRDSEKGPVVAEKLASNFIPVDVSDPESVEAALSTVPDSSSLRVVVNCAGIGGAAKTVSRGRPHDFAKFARTLNVNLMGTFNVASQAAALMAGSDPVNSDGARGVIINTASVAAFDGQVGQLAYSASKGGIVSMTLPMARDLADKGIRVNTVAPGLFLTPLMDELPKDVQDSLGAQIPFPSRLGNPEEFAHLVCSLIANPMMNGEVVRLDGAIRMAPR